MKNEFDIIVYPQDHQVGKYVVFGPVLMTNGREMIGPESGKFEHKCTRVRKSLLEEGLYFCDFCHGSWRMVE